jgi:hypothetical protein
MKEIIQRIVREKNVLLFWDYEGTVVFYKKDSRTCGSSSLEKAFLEALDRENGRLYRFRPVAAEIRTLVDIEDIAYIGNRGWEILYK